MSLRSPLVVTRNRTVVGGFAVGKIKHHFLDIAPPPAFGRVITFDDRMPRRVKVFGRVPARRLVTASDMPARATDSQMKPSVACLETFFAA